MSIMTTFRSSQYRFYITQTFYKPKKYFEILCMIPVNHWINHVICSGRTNKVGHHLRCVVWCGGDAQQLFSFCHSGVVDCLDVDAVTRHHDVTDLSVLLCICNLPKRNTFYTLMLL